MKKYVLPILICFLVPVFLMPLLSLALPDRAVSERENRTLAAFPTFSAKAVFDGSFATDFETYFSDQFPLRDLFLTVNSRIEGFFTASGGETSLVMTDGSRDMGAGESLVQHDATINPWDVTVVKPRPTPAPLEESTGYVEDKGSIIISNYRAMEVFGTYEGIEAGYVDAVQQVAAAVGDRANVYLMVVPTSIEFYSPEHYHTLSASQKDMIQKIYESVGDKVIPVDAYTYLAASADQYIYFRTDHHWTARGAYAGYKAFCEAAKLKAPKLYTYPQASAGEFVGTMYTYTQSAVLKDNPDIVELFLPPEVASCKSYTGTAMTDPVDTQVFYRSLEGTSNKYLTFLGGDHALLHLVTHNKNGKRIAVIKDSFGNAFVPYLIENYEEIYVIDPRKITMNLPWFLESRQIGDVLIENYSFAISNSSMIGGLTALVP